MVEEILKKLDFNEKEIQIYLAVLGNGKITPSAVSKLTKINRTTVYSTTKELIKKGIIKEDLGGSVRSFVALPPKNLENLWEKEQKKLEEKKIDVMQAIRELGAFTQDTKYSVPKIVFVEEEGIEDHLYKQASVWNQSLKHRGVEYWGFQDSSFVNHYEKWIDWYWTKEPSSDKIMLKLLSTEEAEQVKSTKYDNRQIRFWDKAKDITATTWVMGDYVTMIVTNKKPHYLVEIVDEHLAHNMRQMFKGIWQDVIEDNKA